MKNRICIFLFLVLLFLVSSLAMEIDATPLFSMRSAVRCDTCHEMPDRSQARWVEENYRFSDRRCRLSCSVCHTNASGGMHRNDTGKYFGAKTLAAHSGQGEAEPSNKAAGHLLKMIEGDKSLSLGGDFRFLLLASNDREESLLFFPMQADLYVNLSLLNNLGFFYQGGMQRGGNPTSKEVFGILNSLPFNSYLKAGKFIPPYGHKLDDHTAFIRTKINFDHSRPGAYVSGYEAGAEPVWFYGRFSQFNEDVTPAADNETSQRGFSAVGGWRGLWLHLGGSYYSISNLFNASGTAVDRSAYGVSGSARAKNIDYLEKLIWLFEFDLRRDEYADGFGARTSEDALITFNELNYNLSEGVNLKLRYETYLPDDNSADMYEKRFVAGLDLYPYPHTEFLIQYRSSRKETEDLKNEFLLQYHLWF